MPFSNTSFDTLATPLAKAYDSTILQDPGMVKVPFRYCALNALVLILSRDFGNTIFDIRLMGIEKEKPPMILTPSGKTIVDSVPVISVLSVGE
ncbi:protein of unknown function [Chryseobacterium sp. JV274]|nr:protein of unknown function [Chryseobacterium sp. JV274]